MGYLIATIFGISVAYFWSGDKSIETSYVEEIPQVKKQKVCTSQKKQMKNERKDISLSEVLTKCDFKIPNAGQKFNDSPTQTRHKVSELFDDVKLMSFYEEDNFSNEYTHDSGPGVSKQKVDPRENLFARFSIEEKMLEKIKDYGVIEKVQKSTLDFLEKEECEKPQFFNLTQKMRSEMRLYQEILGNSFQYKDKDLSLYFSFKQNEEKGTLYESIWVYKPWNTAYSSYREKKHLFVLNSCHNAIAQISNLCYWDLSYDRQFKNIYYFPKTQELGVNIFCKHTGDKSWTRVKSYILK